MLIDEKNLIFFSYSNEMNNNFYIYNLTTNLMIKKIPDSSPYGTSEVYADFE